MVTRRRRRWLGAGLAVLVLTILDQVLLYTALADGVFLGVPVAPFDPPLFSPSQFHVLESIRAQLAGAKPVTNKFDPELGWCNKPESGFDDFRYDWAGARIGAAPLVRQKAPGTRRVVAVGCSMTHGEEVGALESWCAQLDARLDEVEIANLGVAAYGIDQALLRLRRDGWSLEPDEVWLGVLPEAALRTTTFFRPLLDHWSLDVAFKPRFLLGDAGELVPASSPARSYADVARLLSDQREFLAALDGRDPWVSATPGAYAPRGSDWRHGLFLGRILLTLQEKRGRLLANAFDDEHEFGRLFTGIVRTMERECRERSVRFRLIVLPGENDLVKRARSGRGYWEDWCERRRAEGLTLLDMAPILESTGVERSTLFAPHGHFNARGSQLVAEALAAELRRP